ncbi:MAG: transglutaminase domain-containing protein [Crocinitomicaceae bacterium]
MKFLVLLLLICPAFAHTKPQQTNPVSFKVIDAYMRNCPASSEKSMEDIAAYISRSARTDLEKARAVYVWVTDNISYNDWGYNNGDFGDNSAENVLQTRVAVCAGFADLFTEIAVKTGIEVITVTGYAKGYGYDEGDSFDESNHAWNAVKIEGSWRIFDATWGQGGATEDSRGKLKSIKAFDETWFNVDPKHSIFTHLSEIPYQNFLAQNISLAEFERLPNVNPNLFSFGWISAEELLAQVKTKKAFNLPEIHALNTSFQILNAPKTKQLKIKEKVRFELSFEEDLHFFILDSFEEWTAFEKTEKGSKINFIPFNSGEIKLLVESPSGFVTVMMYDVK